MSDIQIDLSELGEPTEYGAYWFGYREGLRTYPAIFPIHNKRHPALQLNSKGKILHQKWMVCPSEEDIPFDNELVPYSIKTFDTVEEAYEALKKIENKTRKAQAKRKMKDN